MDESKPCVKVSLLVPYKILQAFDDIAKSKIGVGRSTFFNMGALMLLGKLTVLVAPKKRATLINDLEAEFQTIIAKARESA